MKEKSMLTTLCYIEKGDSYLMLHRIKKESDVNKETNGSVSADIPKKMKVRIDLSFTGSERGDRTDP